MKNNIRAEKVIYSLTNNNLSFKIKNYLKTFVFKKRFLARFNHDIKSFTIKRGMTTHRSIDIDDSLLIERLKCFYLTCDANFEGNKNSVWADIFRKLHGDIHAAFINSDHDKITDILRTPGKYNLFYGFENLSRDLIKNKRLEDILEPEMAMDTLLSTCEAAGLIPMSNPESIKIHKAVDSEVAVQLLETEFDLRLRFPNPFEGEYGIQTSRGILSYRAAQAIYQAWKISTITKGISKPRILEIGGGLGRTAFFCRLFGIYDYSIVDIPISSLAQGNFLGRVLSENEIILNDDTSGDKSEDSKIKLIYPKAFFSSKKKYDLIVNFDSLTELDVEIAKEYLQKISEVGNLFYSINHEFNSFSINSIWKSISGIKRLFRQPSWVRRGYVEELFDQSEAEIVAAVMQK